MRAGLSSISSKTRRSESASAEMIMAGTFSLLVWNAVLGAAGVAGLSLEPLVASLVSNVDIFC